MLIAYVFKVLVRNIVFTSMPYLKYRKKKKLIWEFILLLIINKFSKLLFFIFFYNVIICDVITQQIKNKIK
jgi:hypothetical protein